MRTHAQIDRGLSCMNASGRYRAFISYSHSDERVAGWLHRCLEGYRVPKFLRGSMGEFGTVPDQLQPIFRDREELASAGALGERLQQALADSEALLVICSPDAARSHWVNEEILAFKQLGRSHRIYCLIVAGEPNTGDANECFPPALRYEIEPDGQLGQRPAEPLAADMRPGMDGRSLARLKLLAGLLGIDLDKLRKREAQRRHRHMLAIMVASLAGMTVALALAGVAWIARNDAQRRQVQAESLLGYMLGDLRQKLNDSSQIASMNDVSDKLLKYFASLDPRDLNDEVLTQQAQALTQIGQVRLRQARYPDALASFKNAYRRSKALADRHPGNGDRLFDRGQAEFWVGYVYWQSRDLEAAQTWLTRYRDTCRAVYAMDPKQVKWQRELAYGDSNLAVLELDRGRLQQASESSLRSLGMLEAILARTPDDPQLLMDVADQISWQGNIEEQSGHLQRALALATTKSGVLKNLVVLQPADPNWQAQLSIAETMQSEQLRILGEYGQAEAVASDALRRIQRLTARDPANKDWAETHLRALALRAAARMAGGKPALARDDLALAQPLMDAMTHVKGANRLVRRDIIDVLTLRAMLALQDGDQTSSLAAAKALQALYQDQSQHDSPEAVGRHALSEVLIGMAATDTGRPADAAAHFTAARRLLAPRVHGSRYWRVLDPWARLSLLAGEQAEGARVQAQLTGFGYVPSMPWPGEGPENGSQSKK